MLFSRFRERVFLFIGSVQVIVAILLFLLSWRLPSGSQINETFDLAKSTVDRCRYAASLVPAKVLVLPMWSNGWEAWRAELDEASRSFVFYKNQARFSVSTTVTIIQLVAVIVILHGAYLTCASWFGKAYSP